MKHLKGFKVFETQTVLTQEQIDFLNKFTRGKWSINENGLVDIEGSFMCVRKRLRSLQGIRFGKVTEDFDCSLNKLTSLEGAPQKVGKNFDCSSNQLTYLEGAPQKVGGSFDCGNNQLTSLEGVPQEVGGDFYCSNNQLTSLKGAPKEVGGDFYCSNNQLTSLEGAPQKVGGGFYCSGNELTSLEGSPQDIGRSFDCSYNRLTSLEGAPQEVVKNFDCSYNRLISLEGAPQEVGGGFNCESNPITEESLKLIFSKMKEGNSYTKSLAMVMDRINEKDLKLILDNIKSDADLVNEIIELNSFKIFDWIKNNNTRLYNEIRSKMGDSLDLASDLGSLGF